MRFNLQSTHRRVLLLCLVLTLTVFAQQKAPITPADYGKWETLGNGELSPNGQWLAHGLSRVNGTSELRIRSLTSDTTLTAPYGSNPAFSDDSRWLAYSIGYSEQERDRLTKARRPVQNKMGLLNLTTRETVTIENVASFAFSKDGKFLAMRRYPRAESSAPSAAASGESNDANSEREPLGVDFAVRDLSKGTDTTFGNVSAFAWQDNGSLIALTISAEGKVGNGVQLFDPTTGVLRALDSGAATYTGLVWRKDSADLAVLRSKKQDGYEDETFTVLVWKNLTNANAEKKGFDHTADTNFPKDTRVVRYRAPSWSDNGTALFIGVTEWRKKVSARNEMRNGESAGDEEPAGVEVWHARDVETMPEQKLRAQTDRQKNMLAVWHFETGRFVQLARNLDETVTPIKGGKYALARDNTPYQTDGMFGRGRTDLYLIDIATGERKSVLQRLNSQASASPGGRYLLYFKENHYWTYDLKSGAHTNITKAAATPSSFENREDDHPVEQKQPYGIAGWTKDDGSVIVYDQYDVWELKPDGSKATRLTNGASEEVRYRYARLDPREEFIDLSKPVYLSLYGQWTKRSGYARWRGGQAEKLVWLDKGVSRLVRAKDADVFAYVAQAFDDSPDYFVGGADLKDAKQVTETNAFQSNYAWGHTQLIEYKNKRGERLQGILHYPANYQAGKQYPMIVYIYEKLSQGLHTYSVPSERSPYNPAVFTSLGYFVLYPDIVFRERAPGESIVECVTAAVNKTIETGLVDRQHLGIVGHSWGGYGTAYLASFTDLFAAAVAGAPLTDLVSMYGSVYWNTGGPETNHFEVGQERMQVPLWDDREAYLRNSPITNVSKMKTPLLMTFGDKDGAVDWHQGLEMYNMARRAGKDFVLLVYPGENHSLAKKPNQIDYHRRIVEWFGHYLQGAPAPAWMTKGMTYLEREDEIKRLKDQKAAPKTPPASAGSSER